MPTRSRIRRALDRGRLARLAESPGIDSRTWVCLARVDDDDDAIRWAGPGSEDGPLGWLADVTFVGGPLDGDGPVVCRVAWSFAGDGAGRVEPVGRGCLVLVLVPGGNSNEEPTIVGALPTAGCEPPSTVNGTDITEEYAAATHILVTPHGVDQEVGGDRRIKTGDGKTHRILGDAVELATEGATRSFVRGEDINSAINSFASSVSQAFGNLAPGGPPTTPVTAAQVTTAIATMTAAVTQLSTDLQNALSSKIKGE